MTTCMICDATWSALQWLLWHAADAVYVQIWFHIIFIEWFCGGDECAEEALSDIVCVDIKETTAT